MQLVMVMAIIKIIIKLITIIHTSIAMIAENIFGLPDVLKTSSRHAF